MSPAEVAPVAGPGWRERLRHRRRTHGWFVAIVLLPCLLAGAYLYLVAADQYLSEAHYLVRAQGGAQTSSSGFGSLFGGGSGGGGGGGAGSGAAAMMSGIADSNSVVDYLRSHDVVDTLRRRAKLVDRFRRPEADLLSRLPDADPTPESLLRYYRKQVDVNYDTETGITTLAVRAFRPGDAYAIARDLLTLGEQRVNEMNERSYRDAVSLARRQLDEVQGQLAQVQAQLTGFRQSEREVDPNVSAVAQVQLVSGMTADLAAARAQLATTAQTIGTASPQYQALRQQVRSLEVQLAGQRGRLAGGGGAIAAGMGDFERLRMQQQLLQQRYGAATTAYDQARQQAVRQQLYVVRIVDANMPVKALYPRRAVILLTMLGTLMVVFGIGWLIAAGVREHAA